MIEKDRVEDEQTLASFKKYLFIIKGVGYGKKI
jgi:hypothetical protein